MRRLLFLGAMLFGACPTTSFQSAKPLPKGETRYIAGLQFNGAGTKEQGAIELPQLALGVRYGEDDDLELGVNFNALPLGAFGRAYGIESTAKMLLQQKKRYLSLGTAVGYHYISVSQAPALQIGYLNFSLPWGAEFGERDHQWVLSPAIGVQLLASKGANTFLASYSGFTLGAEWMLKRVSIHTQLSAFGSPAKIDGSRGSVIAHQGVGVSWNKKR